MGSTPTKDGKAAFSIPEHPELSSETYYKIFGDISGDIPPLVILHGGPGVGHEYLLTFSDLWSEYGLPVVFYDQVGCASSTHLPQKDGNKDFWQEPLFTAELENLLDHLKLSDANGVGYHLLGHSFGGRIAAAFACSRPPGLKRLVLASALASTELSRRGNALQRRELPAEIRQTLASCPLLVYKSTSNLDTGELRRETRLQRPGIQRCFNGLQQDFLLPGGPNARAVAASTQAYDRDGCESDHVRC